MSYQVWKNTPCDRCKAPEPSFGCGSGGWGEGDVISLCAKCLKDGCPKAYAKHVEMGNIEDPFKKELIELDKKYKEMKAQIVAKYKRQEEEKSSV